MMMRNTIWLMVMLFFLAGCEQEETLNPSKEDKDWFVITDDSDVPVDKAVYALYKKWNVPAFYNDTIGSEERGLDKEGNPIVFYRVLNLNYSLNKPVGNVLEKGISLVRDEADVLVGIRFLDEVLLPKMPKVYHLTSVLLLDSLYNIRWSVPELPLLEVFKGMETLAIGNVPAITGMNGSEREELANRILLQLGLGHLTEKEPDGMADFYKVSCDSEKQKNWYKANVRFAPRYPGHFVLAAESWEVYGFLDYDRSRYAVVAPAPKNTWDYTLPDEKSDLEDFMMAILSYSPEEFEAKYVEYPRVREKFTLLRKILVEQGVVK